MTIKITKEQYKHMELAIIAAEQESLDGNRAQVFFDTVSGQIRLGHLGQNERYPDDENYVVIYSVYEWEDKLKDLYRDDEDNGVNWDDKNYKFTPEYEAFERWYFDDNVDGFAVFDILDEMLALKGIEVEAQQ